MPLQHDATRSAESGISRLRRRPLLSLSVLALPLSATAAQCKLGDDGWFRRFRVFVKLFNAFVESFYDGKVNISIWREMRESYDRVVSRDSLFDLEFWVLLRTSSFSYGIFFGVFSYQLTRA